MSSAPCLRLYRDDSYLREFTARVTACEPAGADFVAIELDRTAFYPTGGGQPHDTGTLAGVPVVEVREGGDGRILHMTRGSEPLSGEIAGEIDWRRRFDHMQQHTGQHILSRAFVRIAGAATRSFHLGEQSCTIDLDLADPDEGLIRRAEALANENIFADHAVAVDQVLADRAPGIAANMNLARELALKPGDAIRIVKVGPFDETPCGGTHVARSGEVGAVAIRSWERFKGGTRVSFLCGARVVSALAGMGAVVDACVGRLSAQPEELPGAIGRLQDQLAEARRATKLLNEALVGAEAVARDASARLAGTCRVIVEVFPERPIDDVLLLAQKYTLTAGRVALLAAVEMATGRASLVFARSDKGTPADLKMGDILAHVCRSRGGKGGGGPALAQGGGLVAETALSALEEAFGIVSARLAS
ncbi:MAG TPA: alanyl-tRNA editing protein [Candidatus Polarisedimenticolia bacterium]|jgi:alanyl-tRNA synthetase